MGRNQPPVEYSLVLKLSFDTSFYHIIHTKSSLDSTFPFLETTTGNGIFDKLIFLFFSEYIIFTQCLDTKLDSCYNGINIKNRP